jgi:hypothetical protein
VPVIAMSVIPTVMSLPKTATAQSPTRSGVEACAGAGGDHGAGVESTAEVLLLVERTFVMARPRPRP